MTEIRLINKNDAGSALMVYAPYVEQTAITFEYEVPGIKEFEARIGKLENKYPWLVIENENTIIAYAYASEFRSKAAYQWSTESTIYIHQKFIGMGIGKLLYNTLFELLKLQGFFNVYAGMTMPNENSYFLHKSLGFHEIGTYENIGFKNGRWWSTKWFAKELQDGEKIPFPLKTMSDIMSTDEAKNIIEQANTTLKDILK